MESDLFPNPNCYNPFHTTKTQQVQVLLSPQLFSPSSFHYWLLAIGYWLLAIGYWLLAIGYWLLAKLILLQNTDPYFFLL